MNVLAAPAAVKAAKENLPRIWEGLGSLATMAREELAKRNAPPAPPSPSPALVVAPPVPPAAPMPPAELEDMLPKASSMFATMPIPPKVEAEKAAS